MTDPGVWPWLMLLLLGAVHGLNPGMGWLFAVALGMQQQDSRAVWRALPPLAAGHAGAILVAVGLTVGAGLVIPLPVLKWIIAATLIAVGVRQLLRHGHWARGGMRAGPRDLALWSFLMATAHGAGLMALPFALQVTEPANAEPVHHHAHLAAAGVAGLGPQGTGLAAGMIHGAGYLLVTGVIALLVYQRLGLHLLRKAWINLDRIWAGALIATGGLTLLL